MLLVGIVFNQTDTVPTLDRSLNQTTDNVVLSAQSSKSAKQMLIWRASDAVCTLDKNNKFMAHSAVWGHLPIQRQNTNSKKLSKSGLRRFIKFGQAHSNMNEK